MPSEFGSSELTRFETERTTDHLTRIVSNPLHYISNCHSAQKLGKIRRAEYRDAAQWVAGGRSRHCPRVSPLMSWGTRRIFFACTFAPFASSTAMRDSLRA